MGDHLMGLTAKDTGGGGGDYEIIPEDTFQGICYAVYDLGTHYNEKFGKSHHKILICWEIPEIRIDIDKDGETKNLPKAISSRYTLSLHEKSNLRKMLQSWRGKAFTNKELEGFDLLNLLGANCMLQIIHNVVGEKTYANVSQVGKLYKSIDRLKAENPLTSFSFETDDQLPENTPGWIADIIKASDEWQGMGQSQSHDSDGEGPALPGDDEIPF